MKCSICGSTENIIYSGTDAFMRGVETEKTCYPCGNAKWKEANKDVNQA